MMNWMEDHAPIKSGTENFRILLWGTYTKAYSRYQQDATQIGILVLSQATFFNTLHRLEIKKRKFDKYLCPVCFDSTMRRRTNLIQHQDLVHHQSSLFSSLKQSLPSGTQLAVHDYTMFHETAEFKLHDLDVALFWREGEKNSTLVC